MTTCTQLPRTLPWFLVALGQSRLGDLVSRWICVLTSFLIRFRLCRTVLTLVLTWVILVRFSVRTLLVSTLAAAPSPIRRVQKVLLLGSDYVLLPCAVPGVSVLKRVTSPLQVGKMLFLIVVLILVSSWLCAVRLTLVLGTPLSPLMKSAISMPVLMLVLMKLCTRPSIPAIRNLGGMTLSLLCWWSFLRARLNPCGNRWSCVTQRLVLCRLWTRRIRVTKPGRESRTLNTRPIGKPRKWNGLFVIRWFTKRMRTLHESWLRLAKWSVLQDSSALQLLCSPVARCLVCLSEVLDSPVPRLWTLTFLRTWRCDSSLGLLSRIRVKMWAQN